MHRGAHTERTRHPGLIKAPAGETGLAHSTLATLDAVLIILEAELLNGLSPVRLHHSDSLIFDHRGVVARGLTLGRYLIRHLLRAHRRRLLPKRTARAAKHRRRLARLLPKGRAGARRAAEAEALLLLTAHSEGGRCPGRSAERGGLRRGAESGRRRCAKARCRRPRPEGVRGTSLRAPEGRGACAKGSRGGRTERRRHSRTSETRGGRRTSESWARHRRRRTEGSPGSRRTETRRAAPKGRRLRLHLAEGRRSGREALSECRLRLSKRALLLTERCSATDMGTGAENETVKNAVR